LALVLNGIGHGQGKNALILGTGSSANDIALDLQRGFTTVVSVDPECKA
jgi:hypothetical protein